MPDRLLHQSTVVSIQGEDYRLKDKPRNRSGALDEVRPVKPREEQMTTTGTEEKQSSAQVLTEAMAATILRRYQELWNRAALTELLSGFTDDIVVEFADLPTIKGKAELESILKARLSRQKGYRLEKTLRAVTGATIVASWIADWVDATTGRPMKGKGIEFIEMRDDKCARWEATFNAWDAEGQRSSLFT